MGIIPERIGGDDGRKMMGMDAFIENLGLKPRRRTTAFLDP
jgi:hypothetical protein